MGTVKMSWGTFLLEVSCVRCSPKERRLLCVAMHNPPKLVFDTWSPQTDPQVLGRMWNSLDMGCRWHTGP